MHEEIDSTNKFCCTKCGSERVVPLDTVGKNDSFQCDGCGARLTNKVVDVVG